jgi:hypothetical protein
MERIKMMINRVIPEARNLPFNFLGTELKKGY